MQPVEPCCTQYCRNCQQSRPKATGYAPRRRTEEGALALRMRSAVSALRWREDSAKGGGLLGPLPRMTPRPRRDASWVLRPG